MTWLSASDLKALSTLETLEAAVVGAGAGAAAAATAVILAVVLTVQFGQGC